MTELYVIAEVDDSGEIYSFPMAGGRGASIHSVRAFDNVPSAKRSLSYLQQYANRNKQMKIVIASNFTIMEET